MSAPSAAWLSERLVLSGDDYLAGLVADIDAAHTSVDLEVYILAHDAAAGLVLAALRRAQRRGVAVRLLVDGVGSAGWIAARGRRTAADGMPVRVWHPAPWLALAMPRRGLLGVGRIVDLLVVINRRNHRKVAVIDNAVAWVGSFNLCREHSAVLSGRVPWRDTAARVAGPGVAALTSAFVYVWRRSWRLGGDRLGLPWLMPGRQHPVVDPLVRLNRTPRLRRRLYRDLLRRIARARTRIWLTNAYFVPKGRLLRALARAARRGVDVRLLIPERCDHPVMFWVAATFYGVLLRAGVSLFEYQPAMLHAKTALIDDWATVGSTNLNHRSLMHDLEADVVLAQPASVQTLADAFVADQAQAVAVDRARQLCRPRWQRLLAEIALLARYWL